MQSPRTRRVQRIRFPQPIVARLGVAQVALVDLSVLGARVEHHSSLPAGTHTRLAFVWEDEPLSIECRIVRSRVERFSTGSDGVTVYHAGVEFENVDEATRDRVKAMIATFISRALEEQKLNARGAVPQHDVAKMPIFRHGGQLTANAKDRKEGAGVTAMPITRVTGEAGYLCYILEHSTWRTKRTHDPGQPVDGFTISALEDTQQAQLLCDAYQRSDQEGRRMIQLFAQLSIVEGEGLESR
ncbi:MAG TPA: PilZ domain-containing protein [Thermoanaerobaculia bacterium]|jgi:hypothetical protein